MASNLPIINATPPPTTNNTPGSVVGNHGNQNQNPNHQPGRYGSLGQSSPRTFRRRAFSMENTSLTEVLTIYEKLKKPRDNEGSHRHQDVFRSTPYQFENLSFEEESDFGESTPVEPFTALDFGGGASVLGSQKLLDFNKFRHLPIEKYLYFSSPTGLIQSRALTDLSFALGGGQRGPGSFPKDYPPTKERLNYIDLLKSKQYWLNIIDPNEKDLALLSNAFQVHELTLRDIREGNTEEKLEVYKHYMFISLRLLSESDTDASTIDMESERDPQPPVEDVDFNILLFSNFIITIHDKSWGSIRDVLGFLNLLCTYGNSPLTPDFVLFSVFIELSQDAKYSVNYMDRQIYNLRMATNYEEMDINSSTKLAKMFQNNFQYEFQIYKIQRFIKPKLTILRVLQQKGQKRLSGNVIRLMSNVGQDFEEMVDEVKQFSHILQRSQDSYLTMATAQQGIEANELGRLMKRISELALVFLPAQAIGGFMGMNCKVPFQTGASDDDGENTVAFWALVAAAMIFSTTLFVMRRLFFG